MQRTYPLIKITRLEAARRQIETAIGLYFENGDEVSIHTLSAAAHSIVEALCKKAGRPQMFKDAMLETIRPEHRKTVNNLMRRPQNFFKHAGTMQVDEIEFARGADDWVLYDATLGYQLLCGKVPDAMLAYRAWFLAQHADLIQSPAEQALINELAPKLLKGTRRQFFVAATRAFEQSRPMIEKLTAQWATKYGPVAE